MIMMLGKLAVVFINVLCLVGNCEKQSLCLKAVFGVAESFLLWLEPMKWDFSHLSSDCA